MEQAESAKTNTPMSSDTSGSGAYQSSTVETGISESEKLTQDRDKGTEYSDTNKAVMSENNRGAGTTHQAGETPETIAWQREVLPLMRRLLGGMAIFFIVATVIQLGLIQLHISRAAAQDSNSIVPPLTYNSKTDAPGDKIAFAQWNTLTTLESQSIRHRYYQATIMSMGRVWVIYLGFVTGMILALVGASFILGKIREDTSKVGGEGAGGLKASVESSSPGIILASLGTVLMVTTMLARADIDVKDGPLYVKSAVAPLNSNLTANGTQQDASEANKQVADAADKEAQIRLKRVQTLLHDFKQNAGNTDGTSAATQKSIKDWIDGVEKEITHKGK